MYRKNKLSKWKLSNSSDFTNQQFASRLSRIAHRAIYEMSLPRKMLRWNSLFLLTSRYFDSIQPTFFFFFFPIEQREIICERGASGRKSNDLRNWIKPKRKLRNRASSPYGKEEEREAYWDISAGAHTPGANEKHRREFCAPLAHRPLCPSPSPPRRAPTGYPSGWNPGPGFRFAFGACPLTERVSHSIRNNALSAEALFRNDSCCPRGCALWPHAIITFPLAEFPVYLAGLSQFLGGKIAFPSVRVEGVSPLCPLYRMSR